MVKQKVVIKLSMEHQHKRAKALKKAVGIDGFKSMAIDGDKIVVEGDGIDSVILTTALRKILGYAELISVTTGDEKEEKKPEGESKTEQPVVLPHYCVVPPAYPCYDYEVSRYTDSCNIL